MTTRMAMLVLAIGSEAPQTQDVRDLIPRPPVAVVSEVFGSVSVTDPGRVQRTVDRFAWLPEGSLLEVGARSGVTLAFATGNCYSLGPGASARLVPGGLTEPSGKVTSLPSVPPLPRVQVSSPSKVDRAMAVRIRGERITGLYPADDAAVLADEAVLRFERVPGAEAYQVDVEDQDGASVFRLETASTTISISSGVLKPGMRYQWSVRTISRAVPGPGARGETDFSTVSTDNLRARARLREVLARSDFASLALLAEIDRGLGLRWEAREGFRQALARTPDDPGLRAALAAVEETIER